jgi:crotonobetainyl-CoA:carnitine CoA-transferase CaiB-like acyl-CoA transferase
LKAVNFFEEVDHPTEGKVRLARFPVRFAGSPASVRRLAPNLGEHNAEILRPGNDDGPASVAGVDSDD